MLSTPTACHGTESTLLVLLWLSECSCTGYLQQLLYDQQHVCVAGLACLARVMGQGSAEHIRQRGGLQASGVSCSYGQCAPAAVRMEPGLQCSTLGTAPSKCSGHLHERNSLLHAQLPTLQPPCVANSARFPVHHWQAPVPQTCTRWAAGYERSCFCAQNPTVSLAATSPTELCRSVRATAGSARQLPP
jgi:hypothetical protein